jgi:hypothetical protein
MAARHFPEHKALLRRIADNGRNVASQIAEGKINERFGAIFGGAFDHSIMP